MRYMDNTNMVSSADETICQVIDSLPTAEQKRFKILVRTKYSVERVYEDVKSQTTYPDFELSLKLDDRILSLHDKKDKIVTDVGIKFDRQNTLYIAPREEEYRIPVETEMSSDDELALGASASPVESMNYNMPAPPALPAPLYDTTMPQLQESKTVTLRRYNGEHSQSTNNYRGLVNQAMTCYLNSLLQALYMTPEFRNALYTWEFDGKGEAKSIPYQLQKLFVNLQTSPKSSVETTDLTRSFGWDSAEGWQQHDIQELCRVMFDALEQTFKHTGQADLINRLYEGKMIDYVKCLQCNTEKQREDKFLDIPLPVRPFGSNTAYETVEDALRGFVQPETLEGNNQYFCETCNKKCDAHKGLKFTTFPYILTLHLKRFDFDYQAFHRIKLSDKVTFPQRLNLNRFANPAPQMSADGAIAMETAENFMKCEESSTTDSGSALEEDSYQNGTSVSSTTTTPNDQFMTQDDDEGIEDMDGESKSPLLLGNSNAPGPYEYELFAIMIHSGSASGGHYYAYIKDFNNGKWYCFNDQTVTTITQDDIQKSFGGGSFKTYYSSAYSSSINAYMLMYRQIDSVKNTLPITEDQFPQHIKELMVKIRDNEASRSRDGTEFLHIRVHFYNPVLRLMRDHKVVTLNDSTVSELLQDAHRYLNVKGIAPIERCRLVSYNSDRQLIERSFDGQEEKTVKDLLLKKSDSELLLETREKDEVFEEYVGEPVMTKVYRIDVNNRDVDGPLTIRASKTQTIKEFKAVIARKLRLSPKNILLAVTMHKTETKLLLDEDPTLLDENFIHFTKVFVALNNVSDPDFQNKYKQFVSRLDHLVSLYFVLPNMDADALKALACPPLPKATVNGDVPMANNDSNSEDSSLSDNDRTLVDDDVGHTQRTNGEVSDLHFTNGFNGTITSEDEDDVESYLQECKAKDYFFKVSPVITSSQSNDSGAEEDSNGSTAVELIKVLIDKRASHGYLKYKLQWHLHIPMDYFKLIHVVNNEITDLRKVFDGYRDDDRLAIELGRVLRKGEHRVKVYYLNISQLEDDTDKLQVLCESILSNDDLIGEVKERILKQLATMSSKYNHLTIQNCRLRKKTYRSFGSVFIDDQKISDFFPGTCSEIVLQELIGTELASCTVDLSQNNVVLLVRRWYPSKMNLGKIEEIVFASKQELKNRLSGLSGIPEENIEYDYLNPLHRDNITTLTIHTGLQWSSDTLPFDNNSYRDTTMIYYRDRTEALKELTPEERKELNKKDIRSSSTCSPRKERALKIYIDASPKKVDD